MALAPANDKKRVKVYELKNNGWYNRGTGFCFGNISSATSIALAPANDKKRVKVYELINNDWYDRGTGFCLGNICSAPNGPPETLDARIIVTSEEEPTRTLLETRIAKDDGYQKQQEPSAAAAVLENATHDPTSFSQDAIIENFNPAETVRSDESRNVDIAAYIDSGKTTSY